MTRERLLKLLSNLEKLAANPGTPEEGEAAARKAAELKEKHRDLLYFSKTKREQILELTYLFRTGQISGEQLREITYAMSQQQAQAHPHTGAR